MVCAILIDYFSADRTIRFIEDYVSAVMNVETAFVIVDNSCNEEANKKLEKKIQVWSQTLGRRLQVSDETQVLYFEGKYPLILIKSIENGGYAKGNNLGTRISQMVWNPEYVLFTNNDILFPDHFDMSVLTNRLTSETKNGVVGPKIIGLDGKAQSPARSVGIWFRWVLPLIIWPLGNYLKFFRKIASKSGDTIPDAKSGVVYRVMGSFMLCRTERFFEAGMFDEHTFLYGEEMILAERMKKRGYATYYENKVYVIHEGGFTTKEKKKAVDLKSIKNRMESELYYYRNYRKASEVLCVVTRILFAIYALKANIVNRLSKLKKSFRSD